MVHISRLKLRNFKSFKAADIELPASTICFAGPNGSGKSNIMDAIQFVLGETSLKNLRAKKVRELIHSDSRSAEVTLVFANGDGQSHEIKRIIREDGKIQYRLNGKKTTRMAILETVKRFNLDESGRNVIAQGGVQDIMKMNGKERRMIIDSVAGIAEFEEKKKEAIRELEIVEGRIKDANLVLGERKAFVSELEKEREVALEFIDTKKAVTNAKGTLLKMERERLNADLQPIAEREAQLLEGRKAKDAQIAEVSARIDGVDKERAKISAQIQEKQKTNALIRRIEELRASVSSREQLVKDRTEGLLVQDQAIKELTGQVLEGERGISAAGGEVVSLEGSLERARKKLEAFGGALESEEVSAIRKRLDEEEAQLTKIREDLISITSDMRAKADIKEAKAQEAEGISGAKTAEEEEEGPDDEEALGILGRKRDECARDIERLFQRTKEVNAEIGEIDRRMLELRDQAAIHKVRSSPQLANPALSLISEMRKKDPRILGTVADLISFDPDMAAAVEAAAGGRLLYVVVDGVDTATEVIEKLRKAKSGRATFIPLDTIRTSKPVSHERYSSILDEIECKGPVNRAIEFVFAETLLVASASDAKRIGVGNFRMVTKTGEIFERSGVVSGGRSESGILGASAARKIEKEMEDAKSAKESLLQELYSIREQESSLRADRSQAEVEIKTIEMRRKMEGARSAEREQAAARRKRLAAEIEEIGAAIERMKQERASLEEGARMKQESLAKLKVELDATEEEFKKRTEESSKTRADLSSKVSALEATLKGKASEINLLTKELAERKERLERMEKERKDAQKQIRDAQGQMIRDREALEALEGEVSAASKEIEGLFEAMKAHEAQYAALGKEIGALRLEAERIGKDLNQIEIRKATSSTRLSDIEAEAAKCLEFEPLALPGEQLGRMIDEGENRIASLGNVNMAAIDMYEKKKAEIEENEAKIGQLDSERGAILSMISEIDEHKKEAFYETFQGVSDNFTKLFRHVPHIGEGHLYLDNPDEPFESGLHIKIRRSNKDHSLDALSGGEKTLVALMFIFALQYFKPAPFYILDEVDAALDKANSKNMAELITSMGGESQFIIVSHNDLVMSSTESVVGVAKAECASRLVRLKLKQVAA